MRMHGFTDLEDRFLGSEGMSALRSALASVRAIGGEVRAAVAAGLAKDDYDRADKILGAVGAAERILLNAANLKGA
jgi:hypothetical protein